MILRIKLVLSVVVMLVILLSGKAYGQEERVTMGQLYMEQRWKHMCLAVTTFGSSALGGTRQGYDSAITVFDRRSSLLRRLKP